CGTRRPLVADRSSPAVQAEAMNASDVAPAAAPHGNAPQTTRRLDFLPGSVQPVEPSVSPPPPAIAERAVAEVAANPPATPGVSQSSLPVAHEPQTAAAPRTVKEIVDLVEPSIVRISIPGVGLGSGFVLDEQGTIVTNYHVIEGATMANVVFSDKSEAVATGFLAIVPEMDLAALKITPPRALRPLPLAKSRPSKGEQMLAFGAPQGLSFSVSDGIVSAVRSGEEVQSVLLETSGRDVYRLDLGYSLDMTWIQTSTPISPGNSGGPLVNLAGEVVGINTWSRSGENLNFAISAEQVAVLSQRATANAQPFSLLPPRRTKSNSVSKSEVERTLQYWNEIYDAYQAMLTAAKKDPKKPASDAVAWSSQATRLRRFAQGLRKLDVRDVELNLVLITTKFAQNMEEVADALEEGAKLLPRGKLDPRTARSSAYVRVYFRYQRLVANNRRYCHDFDLLRIAFAKAFDIDFRTIFQEGDDLGAGLTEAKK
ncbi:MAG: S1C family serine protease, partial [Pirellulales bacterium]